MYSVGGSALNWIRTWIVLAHSEASFWLLTFFVAQALKILALNVASGGMLAQTGPVLLDRGGAGPMRVSLDHQTELGRGVCWTGGVGIRVAVPPSGRGAEVYLGECVSW
jgi:hypothetical protein